LTLLAAVSTAGRFQHRGEAASVVPVGAVIGVGFGGEDGLRLVERLVCDAPAWIRSDGWLIFEFGLGQDEEIEQMISDSPDLTLVDLKRDLQGIARTAIARRH